MAFLSGSPGAGEIIVIFFFVLVLFGPKRLPEIAKMIGKTLHELRRASDDFKDQIMSIETEVVNEDSSTSTDLSAMEYPDEPVDEGDFDYSQEYQDGADDGCLPTEDDRAVADSVDETMGADEIHLKTETVRKEASDENSTCMENTDKKESTK